MPFRLIHVLLTLLTCSLLAPAVYSGDVPDTAYSSKKGAPYVKGEYRNPHVKEGKKSFFSFMKMKLFGDDVWADWEAGKDSVITVKPDLKRINSPDSLPQVTWIGHSTFLIQFRGLNFLTDPIFSPRASPFSFAGPKRVHGPALKIEDLPPIDFVIISHNHYDHLDKNTVEKLGNKTRWYVPLGHKKWFSKRGIHQDNLVEFDWWNTHRDGNYVITATPSQHWSGRGLGDRFECLWAAWVVQIADFYLWFGGDTGYNPHQFKQIGREFPPFDLALIPIGAYEPRSFMKNMHVNPEEAVQIHQDIGACQSIGMHWGSFPLTAEPVWEPPLRLGQALKAAGIPDSLFRALAIGETHVVSGPGSGGCGEPGLTDEKEFVFESDAVTNPETETETDHESQLRLR